MSSDAGRSTPTNAVYADTEAQLRDEIAAASKTSRDVRYLSIKGRNGTDVFPVYSQVVQTKSHLLVRAYSAMYAYNLSDVQLLYKGNVIPSFPKVSAEVLDANLTKLSAKAATSNGRKFLNNCFDCIAVLAPYTT